MVLLAEYKPHLTWDSSQIWFFHQKLIPVKKAVYKTQLIMIHNFWLKYFRHNEQLKTKQEKIIHNYAETEYFQKNVYEFRFIRFYKICNRQQNWFEFTFTFTFLLWMSKSTWNWNNLFTWIRKSIRWTFLLLQHLRSLVIFSRISVILVDG
jgi:hypothetical protein